MRNLAWILFIACLISGPAHAAPGAANDAWRAQDAAFAAEVWRDQGAAIASARKRIDEAAATSRLTDELRARADYLSQVIPLTPQDVEMARTALERARGAAQGPIVFDLLCVIGLDRAVKHDGPVEPILQEATALAEQLGDSARLASLDQLRAIVALGSGRTAEAVEALTRGLTFAPHDFRRVELLLTRADTVAMNPESKGAIESARADLRSAFALLDPEVYRTFGFQGYAARARLERTSGNQQEAEKFLKEAVRLVPGSLVGSREHTTLLTHWALVLISNQRFAEARTALGTISRTDNLGPSDRLSVANLHARVAAELDGADAVANSQRWLDRAAAELPQVKGDLRNALSFYRTSADVYERTGQRDKALNAWKEAFRTAREQSTRANERMRLDLQTKLDVAAKERENATLRAAADLEAERRLRWSWAFAISVVAAALLAAAWASSARQKRRLAELRDELATRNAQLEERSSSRIRMLAAACHDLRQPAHALGMLAELGVDAIREPDTSRTWLRSIKRCSATLSEMLGELMDLSRLDGGHYAPVIDTVSLDELLHDVRLQYSELAQRKGLAFDAPPCGLQVRSDRQLLRRMVFNGVANAVKYTRTGSVTVSAHVEGGQVRLVVADTGPGIPADKLDDVFQDHVRLDPRQAVDGLGIGLSIVRRAAQLLGHAVSLDSVVGTGTRFTLALGAPVDTSFADGDAADDGPVGNGRLVALIENDPSIRDAMSAVLRRWGFAVAAGGSADAVLDAAQGGTVDLVITDLHLDQGDGLDAVAAVRSRTGRATLPALLVTGDLDAAIAARAAAQHVQLTHKPLPPMRLLAAVTAALHPASPDTAAAAGNTTAPTPAAP